jgi:UDP-2-acetamido-2,6-beta-L-arabino-hexul-4-ose reductase
MKILVTGAKGFVGRNLIARLNNIKEGKDKTSPLSSDITLFEYDIDTDESLLDGYCREADFVLHLAGVNRPQNEEEFLSGNFGFTSRLIELLRKHGNTCPLMISSSIQAQRDNPYGLSKKAGEDAVRAYGRETGASVLIYRFKNIFGKWCRPNYNSAVATFCHNIAAGLPIEVSSREAVVNLVYIDDVVNELIAALAGKEHREASGEGDGESGEGGFCFVPESYAKTLGEIVDLLYSFKEMRSNLSVPNTGDLFEKKLYSTYLSYLPKDGFSYPLRMNRDDRGSFTEIIRTADRGQFSVNISKVGIVKGNHWHDTKNEKFVVVSGRGVIRFRKHGETEIIEYFVSGESIEVVDIPTGYTHNIENLGDTDMVTFMWCNECFNPQSPDTFFLEV